MNAKNLELGRRMNDATEPDGRPTYDYNEIAAALRASAAPRSSGTSPERHSADRTRF